MGSRTAQCPQCEATSHVEASGIDTTPWWCTACNLAFDGSTPEYLHMYDRREEHKQRGRQPPPPPIHLPTSYHPPTEREVS